VGKDRFRPEAGQPETVAVLYLPLGRRGCALLRDVGHKALPVAPTENHLVAQFSVQVARDNILSCFCHG